ncbi:MAG TPA: alpha/beta fold hydrolase [Micromonosporaceae bacterium]
MPSALPARLRRALSRPRMTRRRVVAASVILVLVVALIGWAVRPKSDSWRTESRMLTVQTGPTGTVPISLDTTLYLPKSASAEHPVPAVLMAHGFGGTKDSVASDAEDLADHGYAVMTWTAEGFGRSGGEIHLDSPDWEVKDAQRLLDRLAARPDIVKDAPGDPRVGVVGGSYGGGLALLLAGYDRRVDAIVPMITWNDLATAFLPEATGKSPTDGVFKKQWAGLFFGSGGESGGVPGSSGDTGADAGTVGNGSVPSRGVPGRPAVNPQCGRFAADICAAYLSIASTGHGTDEAVALLRRSSPASILDRIKAPTLLVQGQADTLFPLDQADANARGIAATGTPVQVAWFTGGHDGGLGPQSDQDRTKYLMLRWLDHYVKKQPGPAPDTSFTYSRISGLDANTDGVVALGYSVPSYPGLNGQSRTTVDLAGPPQPAANPPNGTPAAITSLPGVGGGALSSLVSGRATEVPGQHASFVSQPLSAPFDVVGSPTVQIKVASPTGEAVVFVKLYDVDPHSGPTLPDSLVAPVHLTNLPRSVTEATPVTVTLPAIDHRFAEGHRLMLSVATSDQAFATPAQPTVYTVAAASGVTLPVVVGTPIASPNVIWRWVLLALVIVLAVGIATAILVARRRRRRGDLAVVAGYADTPLVVDGLRKEYADGFVAVSRVDFRVERGQVVGLLGPNGAGKTTSLRVLMGLTQPTAGAIYVFGHRLVPGAPVLSRLGALVEGPGFLPHLSGIDNLRLYWRSTGRPEADAHFEEALDIAGLGDAVYRKVKTYSHGMRQRLAIAQAMLGLPELLVLDEPTDGLDPPQIAEMRTVLRRYATGGRAVLVSSHLLAEVEQTCTHVVVMHKGEKVADGPVDDIVGDSPTVQLDVSDVDRAEAVLDGLGVRGVAWDGNDRLVVDLDGTPRADVVAALVKAGVGVDRVVPRRRLEDAFLSLVGGDTKASGER